VYVTVGYELGRGIKYAYLDPVWVELTLQIYTSREGGVVLGRTR